MRLPYKSLAVAGLLAALVFQAARADINYTQGVGTVLFDFICFTTKHCTAHVNINSAGTEIMTTAAPAQIDASTSSQLHTDITAAPTLGSASGGLSTNFQAALSTTVVAVDANPGQLYELYCYNSNASVAFVQLFDLATGSVTLGTTTPKLSYGIPATNASGFTVSLVGTQFSTAISAAVATTATGSGAVGSGLTCNFKYK